MSGQKFFKNANIGQFWRVFWKPEACGQTVLPDRLILLRQKLMESAKIEKLKYDIWVDKSSLKMPKLANLEIFENLKLVAKQCYQTGQFYIDKN